MQLWRPASSEMVREAYQGSAVDMDRNLDNERAALTTLLRRGRCAYQGGAKAMEELIRRYNETPAEWMNRSRHLRNVPVTKHAVNTIAWMLYGKPPSIEVWVGERPPGLLARLGPNPTQPDPVTEGLSDFVNGTLEENRNGHLMLRAARQRVLDGRAVVKVWGVDTKGTSSLPFDALRMDVLRTEDAWPIYDPDDPDILMGLVEWREMGQEWHLWTTEGVWVVKPDLTVVSELGSHPVPGVIPFAVLGDGGSMAGDLIEYQKELINRASVWHAVERACAYPTGVFHGTPGNIERVPEGAEGMPGQPKTIEVGGGLRFLHFTDPDGGFEWVRADADSANLRESYMATLKEAQELGAGLPSESGGLEGVSPEQPTTVMLRWIRAFINRDQMVLDAEAFEDARLWIMSNYAAQHPSLSVPSFNPENADWEVRFSLNPLPQDQRAERDSARAEVLADLRPESLYIQEHVAPKADADEMRMILDMLAAQKQAKAAAFGFGAPTVDNEGPPEIGEDGEEPNA